MAGSRDDDGGVHGGRDLAQPSAPASSEPQGSCLVGRFAVEGILGEGSLARVYRARRMSDGSLVAIKVLHDKHAGNDTLRRRLKREAEAAQSIDHPLVVRVLEHGVDDEGRPFVVMELVEGESLKLLMAEGPLTPARIGLILGQVLSVLQDSHRRGVIHRDLKPDNVLIMRTPEGTELAKVCDFGMAKLLNPESGAALTVDGMVCGTPEYLSPEQCRGGEIDGRSDVYAVGVVLYEMLAGVVPYREATPLATAMRHVTDALPPLREKAEGRHIPRELELVCVRALAKEPAQRFRSAFEMAQALKTAVADLGPRAEHPVGSHVFDDAARAVAPTASPERMTLPGEQLHSKTRVWLGALLLVLVSAALIALPYCDAL